MVDPALLDNVEISLGWREHLHHVGGSLAMHSIMQAGLIAVRKDNKGGWQTVFFTALDPMSKDGKKINASCAPTT